jgi:two-component system phosphate regulon sensor histidine kinase PhoR
MTLRPELRGRLPITATGVGCVVLLGLVAAGVPIPSALVALAAVALAAALVSAERGARREAQTLDALRAIGQRLADRAATASAREETAPRPLSRDGGPEGPDSRPLDMPSLERALAVVAESLDDALRRVERENATLRDAIAGMGEGVLDVGADRRVSLANPALRELLMPQVDPVGRTPLEFLRSDALVDAVEEAATREGGVAEAELELDGVTPRRLLVRCHAHGEAVHGPSASSRRGVIAVFIDVTELRRLEGLRREFVANVSHELRTPIAAVSGAAEMIDGELKGELKGARTPVPPEALAPLSGIIIRNTARLARLVEDLLDLSRIEARAVRLNLEAVAVSPVVRLIFESVSARAARRGLRLVSEVGDGFALQADRRALEQVLANLIENAVKYASDRAVVTVSGGVDPNGRAQVRVSDTGPGIEARHLPRLFERFYRVDVGRARDAGGTGLGLAIVKHLVEAMGGRITVDSAPRRGTTFEVSLPSPP